MTATKLIVSANILLLTQTQDRGTTMIVNGYEIKPEANLKWADLSGAYLIGANLKWANLGEAYLSGADLSGADLSGADL